MVRWWGRLTRRGRTRPRAAEQQCRKSTKCHETVRLSRVKCPCVITSYGQTVAAKLSMTVDGGFAAPKFAPSTVTRRKCNGAAQPVARAAAWVHAGGHAIVTQILSRRHGGSTAQWLHYW